MSNYQLNESNLYVPKVRDFHILIDDAGASEFDFTGYTILLTDEYTYREMERHTKELCEKYGIISLHARKLVLKDRELTDMSEYEAIYQELFDIILHDLSRANYQRLLCFLTSNVNISSIFDLHNNGFEKLSQSDRDIKLDPEYREFYSHVSLPTLEIFKRIGKVDPNMRFYIHIDRKSDFQALSEKLTLLPGSSVGVFLNVRDAIKVILNSYKKIVLGIDARIDSIHIADTASYPLIGVADAFSNFSFNFARVILQGNDLSTDTQKLKYRLFCNVISRASEENENRIKTTEDAIRGGFSFDGNKFTPLSDKTVSTFEIVHAQ